MHEGNRSKKVRNLSVSWLLSKKFWNVNGRNYKRIFEKKSCFFGWFFCANRRNYELEIILTVFLSKPQLREPKNNKKTIKNLFY
tara:strand:- start:5434 stop:5685 length:252 start_codon:yes stop_codon:yes gene_type:complete